LLDFVKDYRTISNVPVPKMKNVNVKDFLQSVERLMKPVLEENNIPIKIGLVPSNAKLQFDPQLIEQIFINIIGNSIYALKKVENPLISINCEVKDLQTIIAISDNGKGISDDILKQIFIPFFTTRKDGSGIGLSLSKNIMKQHNGQLLVSSEEGVYTTFSLFFPNGMI